MEAQLCADNVKTLQNALLCLNKLGESLNIQITQSIVSASQLSTGQPTGATGPHTETTVRLSAINSTSSAFCAFILAQDFFDSISVGSGGFSSSSNPNKLECQVNIRSLLASLKTNTTGGRKLERCELSITDGGVECRLSVRLHYQHGVTKTHRLTYEAQQAVFPSANPDPGSALAVNAQTVQEWLSHFTATGRGADISLWCGPDFCTVRSKSDDFETGKVRKSIQTEVKVELDQFQAYQVGAEAYLTLPLREFKAAVTVSESLMAPLELHFSTGGEPLFIRIYADAVNVEMVIATTDTKPPEVIQAPVARTSSTTPIRSAATGRPATTSQQVTQASTVTESQVPVPEIEPITRQSQLPVQSTPAVRHDEAGPSSQRSLSETLFRGDVAASQEHSGPRSMPPPSVLPARRITRPVVPHVEDESGMADADDGSFDYGGAFDEMEQGIQAGRIHVHGSQPAGGEAEIGSDSRRSVPLEAEAGPSGSRRSIAESGPLAGAGRQSIPLEAESGLLASSQPPADQEESITDEEDTVPGTQRADDTSSSSRGQKRFRPMFG